MDRFQRKGHLEFNMSKMTFPPALFTEPDEPFQLTFSKPSMGSFSTNS